VIVPVRSGLAYTKAAVESFLAQDVGNVSVMIVDNDLSREHYRWYLGLMEAAAPICPLVNLEVKSVAASWNMALDAVWGMADHALVANNDVLLRPDTYRHLLADGGGFVTAVGVTEREKIAPPYHTPDPAARRPHPDFSCFLIRKWVYEKVGPFDEEFKGAYVEDLDMHLRLWDAGIEAYSIDLPFLHHASGTIKSSTALEAERIQQQADRNRQYFSRKYGIRVASPEYYAFFSRENFGANKHVAGVDK
jgi:hypothetical protein